MHPIPSFLFRLSIELRGRTQPFQPYKFGRLLKGLQFAISQRPKRSEDSMTRRSVEETKRFHLFLYKRDLEYLERRFGSGASSTNRLGVGTACREIIHARVKALRAKETDRLNQIITQAVDEDDEEEEFEDAQ